MSNKYQISYSEGVPKIFKENNFSIIFSTYQAGRVMIIGSLDGIELNQVPISIKKPMGIAVEGTKLAIASLDEIIFFSNNENITETIRLNEKKFDTVYIQRASYNTSTIDVHDIHFGDGVLWGVNTLFSCLTTFDINYNFRPKWKPEFIDGLAPEDRCHLNGMAFDDKMPKYVTALSATNHKDGWRENKMKSGVLLEVPSSRTILSGLAMPHSPRIINGELYVLESGKGRLLKVDTEACTYEVVHDFGCFVRGMSNKAEILFIAKSQIRSTSKDFGELAVKENSRKAGIIIFDLNKKEVLGQIEYETTVEEIYDVQIIEDYLKPVVLTNKSEKFKQVITFPGNVFWRKEKEVIKN
ncbi:MAG: hypothetical protein ACI837_001147 [Crocinitomicaceae bacterium]|jgi:uncharacterized protein (TIGR03032 family)